MALEDDKFELDKKRFALEEKRFELDGKKAEFEHRFWHRNFGTMTTFAIAFLGLTLSVAQVWVAYLQKDREQLQKVQEITLGQIQKDREMQTQERRDLRDFVSKNDALIFSADAASRDRMRKLMLSTFSPEIVQPVFDKLLTIAGPAQQETWVQARGEAAVLARQQAKPLVYVHYQDKNDASLTDGVLKALTDAGYRIEGKQNIVQETKGDVRYFHSDEKGQAVEIATVVMAALNRQGRQQQISPLFAGQSFPNVQRNLFEVWIPKKS